MEKERKDFIFKESYILDMAYYDKYSNFIDKEGNYRY